MLLIIVTILSLKWQQRVGTYGEGNLWHSWWGCKLVLPWWKSMWRFLKEQIKTSSKTWVPTLTNHNCTHGGTRWCFDACLKITQLSITHHLTTVQVKGYRRAPVWPNQVTQSSLSCCSGMQESSCMNLLGGLRFFTTLILKTILWKIKLPCWQHVVPAKRFGCLLFESE